MRRGIRTFRIVTADADELDEYEERVQKTVFAFVMAVIVGNMPFRILLSILL